MGSTLVVCCLLLAVPIYGWSGSIGALLGAKHVHRAVSTAVDGAAGSGHKQADDLAMAGWTDVRRSIYSRPAGASLAELEAVRAHGHSHAAFARHHHAATDSSVIALDDAHADQAGGSDLSAPHVLGLAASAGIALLPRAHGPWSVAAAAPVARWAAAGLDRPPKG